MSTQKQSVESLTELESRGPSESAEHTDADEMRREFGIPKYERKRFDFPEVVPDALEHSWERDGPIGVGGTDFLATGKPESGKSTLALYWSIRLLEVNDEAVVWRGSESRSEWVPLAPWTKVCIPAGLDVDATLKSKDPTKPVRDVELEDVAREVVRYDDVRDLNENVLEPGTFHVVYPDPEFKGCQAALEESAKTYDIAFEKGDPPKHWWVAWMLDRVEKGPYLWTSLMFDEVGDVLPQSASKDEYDTYQKVELFVDCFVDARKFGLSVYAFGHSETDIHQLIRHKIRWRITMNRKANPTSSGNVVGVDNVPMNTDMTSHMNIGRALMWTSTRFDPSLAWSDVPAPTDEILEVSLSSRDGSPEDVDDAQREFDDVDQDDVDDRPDQDDLEDGDDGPVAELAADMGVADGDRDDSGVESGPDETRDSGEGPDESDETPGSEVKA